MTDPTNVFKRLSAAEALHALYIDFDGEKDKPPIFLGVLRRAGRGSTPFVHQDVVDETFSGLAPAFMTLHDAVSKAALRAEHGDRRIVSWSQHDLGVVRTLRDDDPELVARFEGRFVNALSVAKYWRNKVHGGAKPASGRLADYLALIGYPVPEEAARGKVGETIRALRHRLEQGLPLTAAQQACWKPPRRAQSARLRGHAARVHPGDEGVGCDLALILTRVDRVQTGALRGIRAVAWPQAHSFDPVCDQVLAAPVEVGYLASVSASRDIMLDPLLRQQDRRPEIICLVLQGAVVVPSQQARLRIAPNPRGLVAKQMVREFLHQRGSLTGPRPSRVHENHQGYVARVGKRKPIPTDGAQPLGQDGVAEVLGEEDVGRHRLAEQTGVDWRQLVEAEARANGRCLAFNAPFVSIVRAAIRHASPLCLPRRAGRQALVGDPEHLGESLSVLVRKVSIGAQMELYGLNCRSTLAVDHGVSDPLGVNNWIDTQPDPSRQSKKVLPVRRMIAPLNPRERGYGDTDLLSRLAEGQAVRAAFGDDASSEISGIKKRRLCLRAV